MILYSNHVTAPHVQIPQVSNNDIDLAYKQKIISFLDPEWEYDDGNVCPVGWVLDDCGSFNQRSCEDYLTGTHRHTTSSVCGMPACVCPEGLVVHKGQCVDPLECHTLIHRTLCIKIRQLLYLVYNSIRWSGGI